MDVIILCGGKGTRLSEETVMKPKPMVEIGGKPIIKDLPEGCVPYGFPFYVPLAEVKKIEAKLLSIGLETFSWPDLPHGISHNIPNHYKLLRCVRFLW